MKIKIKNRFDDTVIFETDAETIGAAVVAAISAKANLTGANLEKLISIRTILPDGDLIGWKKLQGGTICKIQIPANSKRVGGLVGRKCRAEYAVVLEGDGVSNRDSDFRYKVGATVKPDSYDPNPLEECSNGIKFFITRAEAESY